MFTIKYSDGATENGFATTQECLDSIGDSYPNYYAGHDGDLSEGGDRTLVWSSESDSENDDGARAIASIVRG